MRIGKWTGIVIAISFHLPTRVLHDCTDDNQHSGPGVPAPVQGTDGGRGADNIATAENYNSNTS